MFNCLRRQDSTPRGIERKKIVLVGDGECGKTCLLQRFTRGTFTESSYIATLFEVESVQVEQMSKQIELVLCDTAGQTDYSRLRPISYPETDVVIICFSLDRPESLENVESVWLPEMKHFCEAVPILLVGTKKDLRSASSGGSFSESIDNLINTVDKFVHPQEGQAMADKIGAVRYLECSAKVNDGVETVFREATEIAITSKRKRKRRW